MPTLPGSGTSTWTSAVLIGLFSLVCLAEAHSQAVALGWTRYQDRNGAEVDYPAAIYPVRQKADGDGVLFSRDDGRARLRIVTLENAEGDTPDRFMRRRFPFDRRILTYQRIAANFFALSTRRGDKIFYTRCNFATRIYCVELEYPAAEKLAWDPIVDRVSASLRRQ